MPKTVQVTRWAHGSQHETGRRDQTVAYASTGSGAGAYGSSNQKRVPRPFVLST